MLAIPGSGDQTLAVGAVLMVPTAAPSALQEGSRHGGMCCRSGLPPARKHPLGLRYQIPQGEHTTSFHITPSHLLRTPGCAEWSHLQAQHLVRAAYRHIMENSANTQFAEDQPVSLNLLAAPLAATSSYLLFRKRKAREELQSAWDSLGKTFNLVVFVLI